MNFAEVKQLLDAGFTADEIRKMETPDPQAEHSGTPFPAEKPDPIGEPDPEVSAGNTDPAPDGWEDAIKKLTEQVSALTATVQKNNIVNSNQPENKRVTGEDVLSTLFN